MSFEDVAKRRPAAVVLQPVSAVVTGVTPEAIYATPEGQPDDSPVGPCRGAKTTEGRAITPGMHVLIVFAGSVPWIVAVDS